VDVKGCFRSIFC